MDTLHHVMARAEAIGAAAARVAGRATPKAAAPAPAPAPRTDTGADKPLHEVIARAEALGAAAVDVAARTAPQAAAPVAAPRTDESKLFEIQSLTTGQALVARKSIASGTRLFGEDDWADDAERRSFSSLTPAQLAELAPAMRSTFLRFAYNVTPEQIRGTFRPESVRHPVNFINHSCEPNAGYDGADHIVALRRIAAGEQILMDYGTYTFSFDHEFTCSCGAWACRGKVTRDDWPELVRSGLRLPGFMRAHANKALWG